jgi:hypothetical protein
MLPNLTSQQRGRDDGEDLLVVADVVSQDDGEDLLVRSVVGMMVRILLFLQRARRRPRRVPRVGLSSSRREVSRRRI